MREAEDRADRDEARISAEMLGLEEINDPFAAAVRATRMPMIITDPRLPDNPVAFANDSFCRLSGYAREEIVGRNCRFLQGEGTDRATVAAIRRAVEAQVPIETDILNYRKDGDPFWNRLLMAPVRDATGKVAYFFASQVDVTLERERLSNLETRNAALLAEVAGRLREREEEERRFRYAAEAALVGMWRLDLESGTMTASPACTLIFGREAGRPMTRSDFVEAMHIDDRERVAASLEESLRTGREYDVEHRVVGLDGRVRWVQARARVENRPDGHAAGMAGICLDVTERKSAEARREALAALGDRVRRLDSPGPLALACVEIVGRTLELSRVGFGFVDLENETVEVEHDWVAPGVESFVGVLRFRDYGDHVDRIRLGETVACPDVRTDPLTSAKSGTLLDRGIGSFVDVPVADRGGFVALLFAHSPVPREWSADEVAFLGEMAERTRAATERMRAESHNRDLLASLERQVEERTAALLESEARLRQSQKMEAVGQLTGGLAHDFNNLLMGITGSLDIIGTRVAQGRTGELERYVAAAHGAARRAAALTHRLLAFSRRQTLDPRPTDVNRLVADLEDLVKRTVGPAIHVEVVGSAGLWTALVDPNQLENAILNLCINARDAMPDGGRITVETANKWLDERAARERDLPPGQYLTACVTDNGTGMSPEVAERAFDPFFTTKPLGQGTGLGLSMIYGFARQSGGQVRIYSEVGQGTTICVYLPRHHGEGEAEDSPASDGESSQAEAGETVLVVDDEPTIRMLVAEVLGDLGYVALEASDGPSALRIMRGDARIDLLVTDVGLPGGMNGRQVADAGRELRPGLKVLFVTGYAENAILGNGILDRDMHVMTKPFAMDALAGRIRSIIEGARG